MNIVITPCWAPGLAQWSGALRATYWQKRKLPHRHHQHLPHRHRHRHRQPPPPPPPAPERIILRGVNFDFNKSNIKAEFAPILDEAAQTLRDNPNVRVQIEGHTDSIGSEEYNLELSELRAQAVKQYLVSKGIAASRLTTEGRGEADSIAPNTEDGKDNPEGRAMNRRAELKVQ